MQCSTFDSLARFLDEISFNREGVHVRQNVHIPPVFPANSPYISLDSWHSTPVMANCSTCIDVLLEHIIKQSRLGEIIVHENFVAQSLSSSNNLQHISVRCCFLSCGMLPLLA